MGIYDRDYYRDEDDRDLRRSSRGMSLVFMLIMANVILFLVDMFLTPTGHQVTHVLAMHSETIFHPVYWFELITYGFAHDPSNFYHIFGNMLVLFFFGPPIERLYGKREFFFFYLLAVLIGGLVWGIQTGVQSHSLVRADQPPLHAEMLGASGAVTAIVILFACNFPKAQVLLFGILPMPAWALGVMYVLMDTFGSFSGGSNIAHSVHIAGAAFAALYFFTGLRLSRFRLPKRHPHLKLHETPRTETHATYTWNTPKSSPVPDDQIEAEVDRILRKIRATGEASLTQTERETLMYASREYQRRQKGGS
ncbi:MAG: rhomboid family intramembrane serine protease [Thermoguttaceae bacterium]|nr:rhomboid family intramembrane serine protease [Thermoguttaceae bacterium]